MIVKKELLNQLKDFGLNSYESKLWTALIAKGSATAGELSDLANVPRSRSYDVLESLEKKGFIMMKLGKPIRYIAVPPEDVVERIKKNIHKEAEMQDAMLSKIKTSEVMNELNELFTKGITTVEPIDFSGILKGRKNIHSHLDYLTKNAQKSISIVTTETGVARKLSVLKNSLKKAKERNVKIRVAAPLTPEVRKQIADFSKLAEIRNSNSNGRFVIVDGKDIVFMITDDTAVHPDHDTGVWISSPVFASAIETLFNQSWQNMKPFN